MFYRVILSDDVVKILYAVVTGNFWWIEVFRSGSGAFSGMDISSYKSSQMSA